MISLNMSYLKKFVILFFALFCTPYIYAQEHSHATHEHSRNEIGLSTGVFYALEHKAWGSGVHLHYFRTLNPHAEWSLGGSLEQAWVDGGHFNLSAGVKYQLFTRMSIALLPGVTFFSHDETDTHDTHKPEKGLFAIHSELVYDLFSWKNFHLGTVIDYSWTKNDSHIMLGIHTAFCF
jgi:hypothetical protein